MGRSTNRKVNLILGIDAKQLQAGLTKMQASFAGFATFVKTTAKQLALAFAGVGTAIFGIHKLFVKPRADVEMFRTQLKVLYGDAAKAKDTFDWVLEFAKKTPFEVPELVKASIQLKAFGLDAKNWMMEIGDLASALNTPLESIIDSVGKLQSGMAGMAMRQLAFAGISYNMWEEVGIRIDNVRKKMYSTGQLFDALKEIIRSRFGGMMIEQSATMYGMISNLQDAWWQFRAEVGEGVFRALKRDLDDLLKWIDEAAKSGKLREWAEQVGNKLKDIYEWGRKNIPIMAGEFMKLSEKLVPMIEWGGRNLEEIFIIAVLTKVLQLLKAITGMGVLQLIAKIGGGIKGLVMAGGAAGTTGAAGLTAGVTGIGLAVAALTSAYVADEKRREEINKLLTEYVTAPPGNMLEESLNKIEQYQREMYSQTHPTQSILAPGQQVRQIGAGGDLANLITNEIIELRKFVVKQLYSEAGSMRDTASDADWPNLSKSLQKGTGYQMPDDVTFDDFQKKMDELNDRMRAREEAENNLKQLRREAELAQADEHKQKLLTIQYEYLDTVEEINKMAFVSDIERKEALTNAEIIKNKKIEAALIKHIKFEDQLNKYSYKMESFYVGRRTQLHKAFAASAISIAAEAATEELKILAMKFAKEAAAHFMAGNIPKGLMLSAAAAGLGTAGALISEGARSATESIMGNNTFENNLSEDALNKSTRSQTYGGTVRSQPMNVYISPSVSISGDTIFIGEGSVTEMYSGIADVAVAAVKQSIDDGEINLRGVA